MSSIPAAPPGTRRVSTHSVLSILTMGTLFAYLTACAQPPVRSPHHLSPITGDWGGPEARVSAGPASATLEFPCATGRIEQPIEPHHDGSFEVEGTHTPLRGNVPSDEAGVPPPATQTVRYIGRVRGDEMKISIRFPDAESPEFELKRGASATVPQCSEIRNSTMERTI